MYKGLLNSKIQFTFTGTDIKIIGTSVGVNPATVSVVIDDMPTETFSNYNAAPSPYVVLYEKNVAAGSHNVTLTNTTNNPFYFEAIDVDSDTVVDMPLEVYSGTNIASPARPFTSRDKFAVAYSNEILGGRHSVDTTSDRNYIYALRRAVGMTCYVAEEDKTYKLINNPTTDITSDSDWELDVPTADDIKVADGSTLTSKLDSLELATDKFAIFCLSSIVAGPDTNEQFIPFRAKTISVDATIPVGTVTASDIKLAVEYYDGSSWTVIGNLTILAGSIIASQTTINLIDLVVGNKLRVNVISTPAGVESLNVVVGLELTK